MAEGIPLVLDPESVTVLGTGEPQNAFASGNLVRYVPDASKPVTVEKVVTIEYAAYPIGDQSKARSGRVSVTVKPLPGASNPNQAPVARSFSASVVSGEPLTVTVPVSGVDPDGDSVTVQGIEGDDGGAIDLSLGRVTGIGTSTIKFEAYPRATGTEVLHYTVADRYGAEGTGFVRIGVVAPGDPQPPVAVQDEVRAAPGKTVTLDPTENDLIARGDAIDLQYKELNAAATLAPWKVDLDASSFRTAVPPVDAGPRVLTYGIDNGVFDPSKAAITVLPVPGATNRPVAVDDVAKPVAGQDTALVDVLANDRDIDGDQSSLRVDRLLSAEGTIEGRQVRVRILDHPHTVPYVIRDEDGQTAMALIHVPTGDNGLPFVVSGSLIEMDKDSTEKVSLSTYVKSPRARVVALTTPDTLSASPAAHLSVTNEDKGTLTLRSTGGYVGPGAVMLEVTDQESVEQKDFRTAYVSIPVQIGPKVPLLSCPDFSVNLVAAGRARNLDIPTLCHAWLPPGMTFDQVRFDVRWEPEPRGVSLDQGGTGGRSVTLKADRDAPSSTNGRVRIQARGADEVSYVKVNVLGLRPPVAGASGGNAATPATDANGNPVATTAPPPRVRPFSVAGLKAGSSRTVDLRSYLDSPLDKPQCSVGAARIESGKGLTARASGCTVTITADQDSSGTGSVTVTVSDGPGRTAVGRGTISVLGRPLTPTGVRAVADRVNGGTARVSWAPPGFDGGSPITSYAVKGRGPGARTTSCSASPCTISGLQDGEKYWFAVAAVNGIGTSNPSPETGPVVPDTRPNAVSGVRMVDPGGPHPDRPVEPAGQEGQRHRVLHGEVHRHDDRRDQAGQDLGRHPAGHPDRADQQPRAAGLGPGDQQPGPRPVRPRRPDAVRGHPARGGTPRRPAAAAGRRVRQHQRPGHLERRVPQRARPGALHRLPPGRRWWVDRDRSGLPGHHEVHRLRGRLRRPDLHLRRHRDQRRQQGVGEDQHLVVQLRRHPAGAGPAPRRHALRQQRGDHHGRPRQLQVRRLHPARVAQQRQLRLRRLPLRQRVEPAVHHLRDRQRPRSPSGCAPSTAPPGRPSPARAARSRRTDPPRRPPTCGTAGAARPSRGSGAPRTTAVPPTRSRSAVRSTARSAATGSRCRSPEPPAGSYSPEPSAPTRWRGGRRGPAPTARRSPTTRRSRCSRAPPAASAPAPPATGPAPARRAAGSPSARPTSAVA